MQPFLHQRVHQAEHEGRVRVGADGYPLGTQSFGCIAAHRADAHEFDPRGLHLVQPVALIVAAHPTHADLGVLGRHASE